MNRTERLIMTAAETGHLLGRSISSDDSLILINQLRLRLGDTSGNLDLSPKSLKVLAKQLLAWHQRVLARTYSFNDEETLQVVREIAAYCGQVLVKHAHGQWHNSEGLWGTEIVIERPVEVAKGDDIRRGNKTVWSLGQIAASSWDAVTVGVEPKLYKTFQLVTAKRITEALPKKTRH